MIPKRLANAEDPALVVGGLRDELREKSKLLCAESDKLNASTGRNKIAYRRPLYVVAQRDTANKQVAELQKFKDEALPLLSKCRPKLVELDRANTELRNLNSDTEALIGSLELACAAFCAPDASDIEEAYNRRRGAETALRDTIDFLRRRGVERRLCVPLVKLWRALRDVESGISIPNTSLPESERSNKEHRLKAKASWAVTGLDSLGVGVKKAYDIVAEATGLPRDALRRFRNDITAPKRRGPKEAQLVYDLHEYHAPKSSNLEEFVEDVLDELRDMRDTV